MDKEHYEELILNRIDKNIDKIMPIGSAVSFIAAIAILTSSIDNWFALIDLFISVVLLVMFILRGRIKTKVKVSVTIVVPLVLGILTFMDGGFHSGAITLMLISNTIAVLFLSKRDSVLVSIITVGSLLNLWVWSYGQSYTFSKIPNEAMWVIQILLLVLFLFIYHLAVYTIRNYLLENIEHLEEAVERTYALAYYDEMTGLPNHNLFTQLLEERIVREPLKGYLVIISLKSLNVINSVYGIEMGNKALVETTRCLNTIKEDDEILARVGGNEFLVWIDEKYWKELDKNLHRVLHSFFNNFAIEEIQNSIEHYICYSEFDSSVEGLESALQKVNLALTYAKQHDVTTMVAYNEGFEEGIKRTSNLRELLKDAIHKQQFIPYYQTKVDGASGKVVGVEALARWFTQTYGSVGPDEFVPLTEDMNFAQKFGQIIVRKVVDDYPKLIDKYGADIVVSINISPTFLRCDGFIDFMTKVMAGAGISYNRFILEITEEVVIEGVEEVSQRLDVLRQLGFAISLDDFGTGYSSLNYLSKMNVDELKIDKVLIDHICDNKGDSILLETIIHLAKQYKLSLVAEGVESKEQRDKLLEVGCPIIQGYYYSKPEAIE